MAQINPGDTIAYSTPGGRYTGTALLIVGDRVLSTLSRVRVRRTEDGREVDFAEPEQLAPVVLRLADVETI